MIPVDTLLIPVSLHLLSEEDLHCFHIFLVGDNHHVIIQIQLGTSFRDNHFLGTPDTRNDKLQMTHLRNLCDGLATKSRIHHNELGHIGMVVLISCTQLQVGRSYKKFSHHDHSKDNTQHTQRIGQGTSECRTTCRHS